MDQSAPLRLLLTPRVTNAMLPILIFGFIAIWCWFGTGPLFLRWPAVVVVVALTSGHPLASVFGEGSEELIWPLLNLLIALFGLWIVVRGVFGGPRRRCHYHHDRYHRYGRYGRRWRDDRW